jgi:SAM-dependent methyltransferase
VSELSNLLMDKILAIAPSQEIAPEDQMFGGHGRHYFGVGRSAMMNIMTAMMCRMAYAGGDQSPEMILDFGCGHGRVARYLRAAFPSARVEVTDYNKQGVAWCAAHLGCHDMGDDVSADYYDLIWVGSVITHLPEEAAKELLASLKRALRPYGVLVITTGGRLGLLHLHGFASAETDRRYKSYSLSAEGAATIVKDYHTGGHGYHDYPNQKGYGCALISSDWMARHMLDDGTIQLMLQEIGWDTHQDVYAFMRTHGGGMFALDKGRYY